MTREELESGLKKYEIISPLLADGLEAAQKRRLRKEITARHAISDRSLRRYLGQYAQHGYEGLARNVRSDKGVSKSIPADVLQAAIELRRELPGRSLRRIITILESEGMAAKGEISKSTLSRQLLRHGYGKDAAQRKVPPARRFQKVSRNALWQADIKYGPHVPTKSGRRERTYLMAIIDDATRMVVHAEFYHNQRQPILEDAFRKALAKFGVPESVYVDNGKIFVSKWFRIACGQLGIAHVAAKPYSPQSKGKVERFNGIVNEFLEELTLEPAASLAELNRKFRVWLEEGYVHKPHDALAGKTPFEAYRENPKKVRFTSSLECNSVFMWEDTRMVTKTGEVKLKGAAYDAGGDLSGKKVDLRFDPFNLSVVEIWHNGIFVRRAHPLVIPEFIPNSPKDTAKPIDGTPLAESSSRLFTAYSARNAQRDIQRNGAISFADFEAPHEDRAVSHKDRAVSHEDRAVSRKDRAIEEATHRV
jgi:transposase InsO family protein